MLVYLPRRAAGDENIARRYVDFVHKDASYRISSDNAAAVQREIRARRGEIERYIDAFPKFGRSFLPLSVAADAPEIVRQMAAAGSACGVGPMAAVAGAIAECACRAGIRNGGETIVENGGDIYLILKDEARVGVHAGISSAGTETLPVAFRVGAEASPIAICSSSSYMGHSTSLGRCNLATVVAKSGALADAAATAACNAVRCEGDVQTAAEWVMSISGVLGALIVKGERVGLSGIAAEMIERSSGVS